LRAEGPVYISIGRYIVRKLISKEDSMKWLFWVSMVLVSCAPTLTVRKDNSPTVNKQDSLVQLCKTSEYLLLNRAYTEHSESLRDSFFQQWQKESDSLRQTVLPNTPAESTIYEIFNNFYNPDTTTYQDVVNYYAIDSNYQNTVSYMKQMSEKWETIIPIPSREEIVNQTYNSVCCPRDAKYLVVQGTVQYRSIPDKIFEQDSHHNAISNDRQTILFHPAVSFYGQRVLYADGKFEKVLDAFLFERSLDECMAKRNFIAPEIRLSPEHWGNGWHYVNFPDVFCFSFNESLTRSKIEFRSSFNSGGVAEYEKRNGVWVCISRNDDEWIE